MLFPSFVKVSCFLVSPCLCELRSLSMIKLDVSLPCNFFFLRPCFSLQPLRLQLLFLPVESIFNFLRDLHMLVVVFILLVLLERIHPLDIVHGSHSLSISLLMLVFQLLSLLRHGLLKFVFFLHLFVPKFSFLFVKRLISNPLLLGYLSLFFVHLLLSLSVFFCLKLLFCLHTGLCMRLFQL